MTEPITDAMKEPQRQAHDASTGPEATVPTPAAQAAVRSRPAPSLSVKLMILTALFVMMTSVAGFVPTMASFRLRFLEDRVATAEAASILLDSAAWNDVSQPVQDQLLATVGATAIVLRTGPATRLLAATEMPADVDETVTLGQPLTPASIGAAFTTLLAFEPRTLRVIGQSPTPAGATTAAAASASAPPADGSSLELVISDRPLRNAMLHFGGTILMLSALISIIAAIPIYIALQRLFVRPMRRLAEAMTRFSEAPEDSSRIIVPSGRTDEIGVAETELAAMQAELSQTLREKTHLADLGLAVSKVNHDLRNLLASAQLFSDRIAALPDPAVQRFAPKLIATLGRAIDYCQTTLAYGRAREPAPNRRLVALARVAHDVVEVLGLEQHPTIRTELRVEATLEIDADPDQLFRVLLNLCRNAIQAMDGEADPAVIRRLIVEAEREGAVAVLRVADTGPGVPERAKANLFQAFHGSVRPGGTGLGLAIAAEIIRAHGGTIVLVESGAPGATAPSPSTAPGARNPAEKAPRRCIGARA